MNQGALLFILGSILTLAIGAYAYASHVQDVMAHALESHEGRMTQSDDRIERELKALSDRIDALPCAKHYLR